MSPARSSTRLRHLSIAVAGVLALVIASTWWLSRTWADSSGVGIPSVLAAGASSSPTSSTSSPTAPASAATATTATAPAAAMTSVATAKAPATLSVSLADLGVSGVASVAVYDLDDSEALTAGSGTYETASIVKVDILVSLLVQRGGTLTTSQKALAKSMITVSDNSAATALFQAIGGASGLNTTNRSLGLVETTAGTNGNWGLTRTTAADQLRLLKLIFTPNTILTAVSRQYVASLMSSVTESQDWGITAAGDDEDDSAVKNGWLQRTTTGLWDVTSIGYIEAKEHHLLVVALVTSAKSEGVGISTIEKAASATVNRVLDL